MAFYPGAWRTVLQAAKIRFRRHVFLNQAFPLRSKDLSSATVLLSEEIARAEADGVTLDHGKSNKFYFRTSPDQDLTAFLGYPQSRDMAIVVRYGLLHHVH